MSISNFSKEDFQQLLEAWGLWATGLGCNLNAVSCTQIIWAKSMKGNLFTENDIRNVEAAMLQLQEVDAYLYEIIKFRYIGGAQKSIREIELRFRVSTRKASDFSISGESIVRALYYSLKKCA